MTVPRDRFATVVLASGSPRRLELLASIGLRPAVMAPDVDETPRPRETPVGYVARLAVAKARAVAVDPGLLVVAADTTVDLDGGVVGKPSDVDDARRILRRLSGRTHRVHTAVAVRRDDRVEHAVVTTAVTFVELDDAAVDAYVRTGEPMDKAGAYGIQGAAGRFVRRVDGSVTNVVGLPLAELDELVARFGERLAS